MSFAVV